MGYCKKKSNVGTAMHLCDPFRKEKDLVSAEEECLIIRENQLERYDEITDTEEGLWVLSHDLEDFQKKENFEYQCLHCGDKINSSSAKVIKEKKSFLLKKAKIHVENCWDIKIVLSLPETTERRPYEINSMCSNYVFGLFQYIRQSMKPEKLAYKKVKFTDYQYIFAFEEHLGKVKAHGLISGPFLSLVPEKVFKKHFYKKNRGIAEIKMVEKEQRDFCSWLITKSSTVEITAMPLHPHPFVKLKRQRYVACPNYPNCNGTIIDWMKLEEGF